MMVVTNPKAVSEIREGEAPAAQSARLGRNLALAGAGTREGNAL